MNKPLVNMDAVLEELIVSARIRAKAAAAFTDAAHRMYSFDEAKARCMLLVQQGLLDHDKTTRLFNKLALSEQPDLVGSVGPVQGEALPNVLRDQDQ